MTTSSPTVPDRRFVEGRGLLFACALALAGALVFGGATRGDLPGALAQFSALPLVAMTAATLPRLLRGRRTLAVFLAGVVALCVLQLAPLPAALWTALPGRAPLVEALRTAGLEPGWFALSVAPFESWRATQALLPALALFLGTLGCDSAQRRILFALALAAALVTVLLQMAQIMEGPDSALRFWRPTDTTVGVGAFANRNHTAALLYCALPIAAALLAPARARLGGTLAFGGVCLALLLGLAMTGSRAALVLGAASLAASLVLIRGERRRGRAGRWVDGRLWLSLAALGGLALLFAFGAGRILLRFLETDTGGGDRLSIAGVSLRTALGFFPFGAGFGTFERVYPLYQQRADIVPAIVNHAHDDFLELVIEAGVAGALAIVAGLALLARPFVRALRAHEAEGVAAGLVITLLLAHSIVDYPLRMPAIAALFALCAGALLAPQDGPS